MDKLAEQIFRVFNHLAREIQIYFLSGFVVFAQGLFIDHFYFNGALLLYLNKNDFIWLSVALFYITGQFLMGVYYIVFEMTNLETWINNKLKFNYKIQAKLLPKLYMKDRDMYLHFVERYIILTMMRTTLCSACLISFIINASFLFIVPHIWQTKLLLLISGIGIVVFYLLAIKTEKDYAGRIDSLNDTPVVPEPE